MRKKEPRPGQIGDFWLDKKPGRKAPDDPWCRTWYDPKARQTRHISLGTSDFREAGRLLAEWTVLNDRPSKGRPDEVQIETCLLTYWEDHGRKISNPRGAKYCLNKWREFWKGKSVSEITPNSQRQFRAWLGEGTCQPSTIDKVLAAGRAALRHAIKNEELSSMPQIHLIETDQDRQSREPMGRPLSPMEMSRLFDAADSPPLFIFMLLLANTLARPEAAMEITRDQFDLEHDRLNLNPKGRRQTKKYRPIVPVTNTLRPWLARINDPTTLYIMRRNEPVISLRKTWDTMRARASLPDANRYSFRHGMARELRKRKVPIEQIALFLGHKPKGSDITTSIYAPFEPDYCGEARAAIDAVMEEVVTKTRYSTFEPAEVLVALEARRDKRHLPEAVGKKLDDAIRLGRPVAELVAEFGISPTSVYKRVRKQRA